MQLFPITAKANDALDNSQRMTGFVLSLLDWIKPSGGDLAENTLGRFKIELMHLPQKRACSKERAPSPKKTLVINFLQLQF